MRYFLLGFLSIILSYGFILIYMSLWRNPPYFTNAENMWLVDLFAVKNAINAMPRDKKRLIIISGSNSLFGFNGELIDKNTEFFPINYAAHAGLPLEFLIDILISNAKNGDVVFMPLEFEYYTNLRHTKDEKRWRIHNSLAWLGKHYINDISKKEIFSSIISQDATKILARLRGDFSAMFKDEKIINPIEDWREILLKNDKEFRGYSYKSLNKYGDFATQEGEIKSTTSKQFSYFYQDLDIPYFAEQFFRLQDFANKNNIKIFLTYPTSCENPQFSAKDSATSQKIKHLKSELANFDIKIYGDFLDFHFESKYFFDTQYHLNAAGANLRTKNFIKMLETMKKENLL